MRNVIPTSSRIECWSYKATTIFLPALATMRSLRFFTWAGATARVCSLQSANDASGGYVQEGRTAVVLHKERTIKLRCNGLRGRRVYEYAKERGRDRAGAGGE
jgi:hypothetical protein